MAVHFGTTSAGGPGVMRQMDSGDVWLSTRQGKAKSKSPPFQNQAWAPPFDRSKVNSAAVHPRRWLALREIRNWKTEYRRLSTSMRRELSCGTEEIDCRNYSGVAWLAGSLNGLRPRASRRGARGEVLVGIRCGAPVDFDGAFEVRAVFDHDLCRLQISDDRTVLLDLDSSRGAHVALHGAVYHHVMGVDVSG